MWCYLPWRKEPLPPATLPRRKGRGTFSKLWKPLVSWAYEAPSQWGLDETCINILCASQTGKRKKETWKEGSNNRLVHNSDICLWSEETNKKTCCGKGTAGKCAFLSISLEEEEERNSPQEFQPKPSKGAGLYFEFLKMIACCYWVERSISVPDVELCKEKSLF